MKIVAIKDMSVGNETVGDMWKETKLFPPDTPIIDVLRWSGTNKNVVLSLPENYTEEFIKTENTCGF